MKNEKFNSKKIAFAGFGILAAVIATKVIYSTVKKAVKGSVTKEVEKLVESSELSFLEHQYMSFADQFYVAMKGFGTDEKLINEIISKLKTPSDWYELVVRFGERKSGNFKGNLVSWLSDELSNSDLNKYVKIPLSKIGAKF